MKEAKSVFSIIFYFSLSKAWSMFPGSTMFFFALLKRRADIIAELVVRSGFSGGH